jgi:hypothetical protein
VTSQPTHRRRQPARLLRRQDWFVVVLCLALLPGGALAQTADDDPSHQAPAPDNTGAEPSPGTGAPQQPGGGDTHMFGVLPNYATVDDPSTATRITAKQKLKLAELSALAPIVYPFAAFSAALHRQYGPGASGYGKQYVATLADTIGGNFMTGGIMPSIFHTDPRYFRKREGSGWSRAGYAASRVFVERTDGGRSIFNVSEVSGISAATAISNLYYPENSHSISNAATRVGFQLLWDGLSNELKEFWPDFRDWRRRRKARTP